MLKRTITYEDFNGEEQTDVYYFHLSQPELFELEAEHPGGFSNYLQRIIDTKDNKQLVEEFKQLILMGIGEKSEDGKKFKKSDQIREDFSQTAAYIQLYMELVSDASKAAEFVSGLVPANLQKQLEEAEKNGQTPAVRKDITTPIGAPKPPVKDN